MKTFRYFTKIECCSVFENKKKIKKGKEIKMWCWLWFVKEKCETMKFGERKSK